MKEIFLKYYRRPDISVGILFVLIFTLVGCGAVNTTSNNNSIPSVLPNKTAVSSSKNSNNFSLAENITSASSVKLGTQPCPVAVSSPSYWDPIVGTQPGVSAVTRVMCANLTGSASLQALVIVGNGGAGQIVDIYVYDQIANPNPQQIFKKQGLYKGDAKISAYNTVLTAEVDQNSNINSGKANAALTVDLGREFKWSQVAGTLTPVPFPGIFPDITRYQAEADQQQVALGHDPWKMDAGATAAALAATLLKWPANSPTNIVSGGGQQDVSAMVNVTGPAPRSQIAVTLNRLEGNANNIWVVVAVQSAGLALSVSNGQDGLSSPIIVSGTGNAFEGHIGTVMVLDHLLTTIGQAQAIGAQGMGSSNFSSNVSYTSTFKGGAQEGLVALYAYSNADGSIAGAVIHKALLN